MLPTMRSFCPFIALSLHKDCSQPGHCVHHTDTTQIIAVSPSSIQDERTSTTMYRWAQTAIVLTVYIGAIQLCVPRFMYRWGGTISELPGSCLHGGQTTTVLSS